MPAAGHHYTALYRAMGRYSRSQDKQPASRKGASHRTKSLVTLRNGINVIDMGALAWIGWGSGTTGGSRLDETERHARKILTDRRMEKELGNALSFPIYSLIHIIGSAKQRVSQRRSSI